MFTSNNDLSFKENQAELINIVEKICNYLKKFMGVNEYVNYVFGFLVFKYFSEKIESKLNYFLKGITYKNFNPDFEKYNDLKAYILEDSLGFYIDYEQSFDNVLEQMNQGKKIIPIIEKAFYQIEQSSIGEASENHFKGLFEDIKLDSVKLGNVEEEREKTVKFIVKEISFFKLLFEDGENDALGSVYEYLLSKFANETKNKNEDFFTPTTVADLIARIATCNRKFLGNIYDPVCGSGSLLIKLTEKVGPYFDKIYAQEVRRSTYNLARMNFFLRGMNYFNFDIQEGNTLISPKHLNVKFECVVANPPFNLKWSPSPKLHQDERFNSYPKLAPSSAADFAFLQHMLYHVRQEKGIAITVFYSGALERAGAEKEIREYIINHNYIDAIIMLSPKVFFNHPYPTCLIVARKDKKDDKVLFIDGSAEFEVVRRQFILSEENITKIFNTWKNKTEVEHFSKLVPKSVIVQNNYSLSVLRYVESKGSETEVIDINEVNQRLLDLELKIQEWKERFEESLEIYMAEHSEDS